MDIKTRLEDDKLLFPRFLDSPSRASVLKELNKKGIFTVEDLINADIKIFNIDFRKIYTAIIHAFRNAYLNEPLVYDVLLQKKYDAKKYNQAYECMKDIRRLGLVRNVSEEAQPAIEHIWYDYSGDLITMEYILQNISVRSRVPNLKFFLRSFYIDYLEKMKESKNSKSNESTTLLELKIELQSLINMRKELDLKIDDLKEKINNHEEGNIGYGKK